MLRVDRDPTVSIPIEDIEAGIRNAEVCLAEITTDNPNVWFELGFAIASQRDVVLVCSSERKSRFPFDIQHRSIIRYDTESSSDFEALKNRITERLRAILSKEERILQATKLSPVAEVEGLAQHEMVTLVAIAETSTARSVQCLCISFDNPWRRRASPGLRLPWVWEPY